MSPARHRRRFFRGGGVGWERSWSLLVSMVCRVVDLTVTKVPSRMSSFQGVRRVDRWLQPRHRHARITCRSTSDHAQITRRIVTLVRACGLCATKRCSAAGQPRHGTVSLDMSSGCANAQSTTTHHVTVFSRTRPHARYGQGAGRAPVTEMRPRRHSTRLSGEALESLSLCPIRTHPAEPDHPVSGPGPRSCFAGHTLGIFFKPPRRTFHQRTAQAGCD